MTADTRAGHSAAPGADPWGPRRIVVTIPGTPPRGLAPNARIHHLRRAELTRGWRHTAMLAALDARFAVTGNLGGGPVIVGPVQVTERVYWGAGERGGDLDRVPVLCKGAMDGICDAQLIGDDAQVRRLVVEDHRRDALGIGFVEIVIEVWTEDEA